MYDPRKTRRWRNLKARIIRRDAGICHLCGQPGADTADHLEPFTVAPHRAYDPTNLAAAHQRCNRVRGHGPIDKARAKLTATVSNGWQW